MQDKVVELIVRVVLAIFVAEVILSAIGDITGSFRHASSPWVIGIITASITTMLRGVVKKDDEKKS